MSKEKPPAEEPKKNDVPEDDKKLRQRPRMRFKYRLLLMVVSVLLMAFLRTGFIFVMVALLPSIIAYYFDTSKGRYLFRSVFACNLSGFLPFLGQLLGHGGPSSMKLQAAMGSASNWFIIYGAAFIGWLLVEICPMITQVVIAGFHRSQVARFENMQKKIENEWGPEVTQFSKVLEEPDV